MQDEINGLPERLKNSSTAFAVKKFSEMEHPPKEHCKTLTPLDGAAKCIDKNPLVKEDQLSASIKEFAYKPMKDNVCIIGCSDSKTLAPVTDPNYEFWGVNNLFLTMPQVPWTRWFEIHEITHDGAHYLRRGKREFRGMTVDKYWDKVKNLPCMTYVQKQWPDMKNGVLYPVKKITNIFGRYFTNTISWQIALALFMGFKKIDIYGVDMAVGSEYGHQRPSCEYFIGIATGLGVPVYLPPEADLLKTRFLYAFEEQKERDFTKKVRHAKEAMVARRVQAMQQRDHLNRQVEQYIGAEVAMNEMEKIWEGC